jgi:THO complex subunit 3
VGGSDEGIPNPSPLRSLDADFGKTVSLTFTTGSGLEVTHTETGDHVHSFKTAGTCPVVSWAPTRYCLAYSDLGMLRIVGVDAERKY